MPVTTTIEQTRPDVGTPGWIITQTRTMTRINGTKEEIIEKVFSPLGDLDSTLNAIKEADRKRMEQAIGKFHERRENAKG
jgi:hypothetical protein